MLWTMIHQYAMIALATMAFAGLPGALLLANPVQTAHVQAELGSVVTTIQPGASFWVVLHLRMQDGWHTYWQNPGDAGLPTIVRWVLPEGFMAGDIVWPYPQRLPMGSLMNFGYEGEVSLLMRLTAPSDLSPGQIVALRAKTSWAACDAICVPETVTLDLKLPVRAGKPPADDHWLAVMEEVQPALPQPTHWPVVFSSDEKTLTLQVITPEIAATTLTDAAFFPLASGIVDYAAPQQVQITPQGLYLMLQRGPLDATGLTRIEGVLVLRETRDGVPHVQAFTISAIPAKTS